MAEVAFETLYAALESTRGTAVNPPTRFLSLTGGITPKESRYRPQESRGTLAGSYRSRTTRRWSETAGNGPLDPRTMPFLLAMLINGGVTSPSTPVGATSARLWAMPRTMTTDNLKSGSFYWGDPNVQTFRTAYNLLDELTINADAGGEDGVAIDVKGGGKFPTKTAMSSAPAQSPGPLVIPGDMQFWLDTSSAIGTTELTSNLVSASLKIPSGVSRKWGAAGTSNDLNFRKIGRGNGSPELNITLELPDMTQYDVFADNSGDTVCKLRWRLNGPEIESGFRYYVEADIWGTLSGLSWGVLENTNRTVSWTTTGEYDSTAATDLVIRVQNDQTTL
ncbi:MAG TPA: hypothetical protein VFS21_33310 [Roseiflexaceae bacterium]|nr:hypothetical protein [Roseiflexaceae bacterium]